MRLFNFGHRNAEQTIPSFLSFGQMTQDYSSLTDESKLLTNSTLASAFRIISNDLNNLEMQGNTKCFFENSKIYSKNQMINSVVHDLIVHGNAYLIVDERHQTFDYIPSDNMQNLQYLEDKGELQYEFFHPLKQQTYVASSSEVLHFKFLSDSQGFYGISPLTFLDKILELEHKSINLATKNLNNSMFSIGTLEVEGSLDETAKENLKSSFSRTNQTGDLIVLDSTMKFKEPTTKFGGFEVLSQNRNNVATIAALFGINPERLGAEQTNSSSQALNEQDTNYIRYYTNLIEDEIHFKLKDEGFKFIFPSENQEKGENLDEIQGSSNSI